MKGENSKRWCIVGLFLMLAAMLLSANSSMAHFGGFITCDNCHIMDNGVPTAELKRTEIHDLCFECHAENGPRAAETFPPYGNTAPKVYRTTGWDQNMGFDNIGAGGDFSSTGSYDGNTFFLNGADGGTSCSSNPSIGKGHSVGCSNVTPPGSSEGPITKFTCTNCHDPHGYVWDGANWASSNYVNLYRNLKGQVTGGGGAMAFDPDGPVILTGIFTYVGSGSAVPGGPGPGTNFSGGGDPNGANHFWPVYLNDSNQNAYYAGNNYLPQGISGWCVQCHDRWHEDGEGFTNQIGDDWRRHPVNNVLDEALSPNSSAWVKIFDSGLYNAMPNHFKLPAAQSMMPTGSDGSPNNTFYADDPSQDRISCPSCHMVHGSPYNDNLRWDYTSNIAPGNQISNIIPSGKGCRICHNREDGDTGSHGGACGGCHTMHNSQGNLALNAGGPLDGSFLMLRSNVIGRSEMHNLCFVCHAENGMLAGVSFSSHGNSAPKVYRTTPWWNESMGFDEIGAGGDFSNTGYYDGNAFFLYSEDGALGCSNSSLGKGHSIGCFNVTPPGSLEGSITGFSCTNCHDPHGTTRQPTESNVQGTNKFRYLRVMPIGAGGGLAPDPDGGVIIGAKSYVGAISDSTDGNPGINFEGAGDPNGANHFWPIYKDDNQQNAYYAGDVGNLNEGISNWCSLCHDKWHEDSGGAGNNKAGNDWRRHPVNNILDEGCLNPGDPGCSGSGVKIFDSNAYNAPPNYLKLPAAQSVMPTGSDGGPNNTFYADDTSMDKMSCLSCHMSHGGPYYDSMRWNYTWWVAVGDQTGDIVLPGEGCQVCHNSSDGVINSNAEYHDGFEGLICGDCHTMHNSQGWNPPWSQLNTSDGYPDGSLILLRQADSPTNESPIANAGADQSTYVGNIVNLDGSGSYDPDDSGSLGYNWTLTMPDGTDGTSTLSDPTIVNPTFAAVMAGTYTATLIVNDGIDNSTPDSADIISIVLGDLDGDGDVDKDDLNILLSYRNRPAGECPECDLDGDGMITVLDARRLVTMCTRFRCATE